MEYTNYKLRGWMGSNRISKRKLSELTGIPYGTLRLKIEGRTAWKMPEIEKLIAVTGLTFEELF